MKLTLSRLNRIEVLNEIFSHLVQITQWLPSNFDNAFASKERAETLIRMIEVSDCGHVGGHDPECPVTNESGYELYNRFLAITKKYGNIDDIKPNCNFTITKLQNYFLKLSKLREKSSK